MSGPHTAEVEWVRITPSDESRGFRELPPNTLHWKDRKFLAVAKKAGASILNATDSDWHEQRQLLERLGVPLEQLCPQQKTKVSRHTK